MGHPVLVPVAVLCKHWFGKPEFKNLNQRRRLFRGELQKLIVFNNFFYYWQRFKNLNLIFSPR